MTKTKLLKHGVESVGKTFWIDRRQWPFHQSHGGGSREYVERGCISSYPVNRSDQWIRFVQYQSQLSAGNSCHASSKKHICMSWSYDVMYPPLVLVAGRRTVAPFNALSASGMMALAVDPVIGFMEPRRDSVFHFL